MRILRIVLELSARELRRRWALVFLLMLVVAAVEMTFAALFFAFAASLAGQSDAAAAGLLTIRGRALDVATVAAALGVVVVLRMAFGMGLGYLQAAVAARDGATLARRLLERYLHAPFGMIRDRNTSELMRNIYNSVDAVFNGVAVQIATIVSEVLVSLGILAVLMIAAPAATIAAALLATTLALVVVKVMHPIQFTLGMRSQQLAAEQFAELAQVFAGLREAKAFRSERFFVSRFQALRDQIRHNLSRIGFLNTLPRLVVENSFLLATVVVATSLMMTKRVDAELLAVFGLFAYAGLRIMPSAARIISSFNMIRLAEPALIEVANDYRRLPMPPSSAGASSDGTIWNAIRLEGVSFRYPGRADYAVHDVMLTVERGTAVGITGKSGSGKSTLVDLVIGLQQPESGCIVTDRGEPLHGDGQVLQRLGYVPQSPILLNASVRENIAFGVERAQIDDARVAEVARLAQIHDFIDSLPLGYDTNLGELGGQLSGGQRQRIAIARALYRRPDLLVFDEATSALDLGTEDAIVKVLAGLRGRVTTLVIAHRLNTIRQCDVVLLMDRGRIAATGSFDTLLTRSAEFHELVRLHELE